VDEADVLGEIPREACTTPARGARLPGSRHVLRDAEVEQLHEQLFAGVRGDEDVGGLDVAVNDAEAVRLHQRFEQLARHSHDLRVGHRAVLAQVVAEGQAA
jgi:hypothetical protein